MHPTPTRTPSAKCELSRSGSFVCDRKAPSRRNPSGETKSVLFFLGSSPAVSNSTYTCSRNTLSSSPNGHSSTFPQAKRSNTLVSKSLTTKPFNNCRNFCSSGVSGNNLCSMGQRPGEHSPAPSCSSLSHPGRHRLTEDFLFLSSPLLSVLARVRLLTEIPALPLAVLTLLPRTVLLLGRLLRLLPVEFLRETCFPTRG